MVYFESIKDSNTKVAFHPEPQGIIQFIGGFISGSFSELCFQDLLQKIYQRKYTLIVYKFPFNPFQFNHWSVAIDILKDFYNVRFEILKRLYCSTVNSQQLDFYTNSKNYSWLGYSLGCKYILLLEILSNDIQDFQLRDEVLDSCLNIKDIERTKKDIERADRDRNIAITKISNLLGRSCHINPYIKNQSSVLIAPEINNTFQIANQSVSLFSFWDFPSRDEVQCLVYGNREFFNLMGLISFDRDTIALDDVNFLIDRLSSRTCHPLLHELLVGNHDEPLKGDTEKLASYINLMLQELKHR